MGSHNHAASLLQSANDARNNLINHLLELVRSLIILLGLVVRMMGLMLMWRVLRMGCGHMRWSTRQIDIDSSSIILSCILQAQIAANLLHSRLDLLDMVNGVVALSDNPVGARVLLSATKYST